MTTLEYFERRLECTVTPVAYHRTYQLESEDFVLIDVRNPAIDFEITNKIAGALEMPQNELESRLHELPKDKTIVVYCWDSWCNLSAQSAIVLLKNGFKVKELLGGLGVWEKLGFPVEKLILP